MQNIPFLIKLNVLHMNSENKTETALRIHKNKHKLQTERNNTIGSKKKSRGRQKYVQNIQKGTRHGKELLKK